MSFGRKIARQHQKKQGSASLAKASDLLGKLEGMKELAEVLKPIGEDLKEARLALAMVIQDQGEADHKHDRFRKALLTALRQDCGFDNIEESVAHYEAQMAALETEEVAPCPPAPAE
jgi:hypothetical protein